MSQRTYTRGRGRNKSYNYNRINSNYQNANAQLTPEVETMAYNPVPAIPMETINPNADYHSQVINPQLVPIQYMPVRPTGMLYMNQPINPFYSPVPNYSNMPYPISNFSVPYIVHHHVCRSCGNNVQMVDASTMTLVND